MGARTTGRAQGPRFRGQSALPSTGVGWDVLEAREDRNPRWVVGTDTEVEVTDTRVLVMESHGCAEEKAARLQREVWHQFDGPWRGRPRGMRIGVPGLADVVLL